MDTKLIEAIEASNGIVAQTWILSSLTQKAETILEEKFKQVVAKTWNGKNLTESDEKTILKKSQRKSFRDKMKSLKKVKK